MNEQETDQVIEAMRPIYLKHSAPKLFFVGLHDNVDPAAEINAYVRQLLLGLMSEILLREAMLVRLGISSTPIEVTTSEKSRVLPGPWERAVHDPEIPAVSREVGGL